MLDEQAVGDGMTEDLDATLSALADSARATDERLRTLARALVGRIVIDLSRGDGRPSRGIDTIARGPMAHGGDLDVEASLDALIDARAGRRLVDAEQLVTRQWVQRNHALSLIIDRSGSMEGERLVCAALGAAVFAHQAPTDHSVLAFAADVLVLKSQDVPRSPASVVDDILALRGFGTTDVALALRASAAQLERSKANRRIAVLLSDGRATAGDDPLAAARLHDTLHVIAPADAAEDDEGGLDQAEAIARAGGGQLVTVAAPSELPNALLRILRQSRLGGFTVLVRDGRVLLAKGDYGHRRWALPGGLVEDGEFSSEAAVRETKEETGLDVELGPLVAVVELRRIVLQVFLAEITGGTERPEPGEISELRWFALDELDAIADDTWALATTIARTALTDGFTPFTSAPLTGPGGDAEPLWTV